jgi:hypothetical protein
MIRAGEIRKGGGQIEFSLAALNTTPLRTRSKIGANSSPLHSGGSGINLSVSQSFVGSVFALSAVTLLFWAVLKLWLFE